LTETEKRPVRVGLVGYGFAGKTFHAPLVQSVDGLRLVAVGGGEREKKKKKTLRPARHDGA
jgi:predicted dehydrogenase